MRPVIVLMVVALAQALPCLSAIADTPTAASATAWHKLTQQQRNLRIISAGAADNGKSGGQCKVWVRDVISRATSMHVTVPSNQTNSRWAPETIGHVVGRSARIENVKAGEIVQMELKAASGGIIPHTAIVGSNQNGSITWLESNYKGDEKVTATRVQSHADFYKSLSSSGSYSVYYIN
ncbi:MAG: hypothetical protein ABL957_00315 [Parvularculaceae bacterium]